MGRRCGIDPVLLWLWHRRVAAAPIRPPSLTSICCRSSSRKSKKTKKKKEERKKGKGKERKGKKRKEKEKNAKGMSWVLPRWQHEELTKASSQQNHI